MECSTVCSIPCDTSPVITIVFALCSSFIWLDWLSKTTRYLIGPPSFSGAMFFNKANWVKGNYYFYMFFDSKAKKRQSRISISYLLKWPFHVSILVLRLIGPTLIGPMGLFWTGSTVRSWSFWGQNAHLGEKTRPKIQRRNGTLRKKRMRIVKGIICTCFIQFFLINSLYNNNAHAFLLSNVL